MEKRYINANVEVRADENEKLTLKGYAIRYNEKSKLLGYGFEEIILQGAFSESLKTRNIIALNNHDTNQLLGSTQGNTLRLEDRSDGLYFELDLLETRKELYDLVKRGDISGMSFGFTCTDELYKRSDDKDIREVKKGELFEISVVHTPAYPSTNVVATRSLEIYNEYKENLNMGNEKYTAEELRGLGLLGGTKQNDTEVRCYLPTEKLSEGNSNVTVGHLIRAYATGKGTEEEKRMLSTNGASTIIPSKVSSHLIDLARSKSFLMSNCTIVDMQNHQKLSIPTVTKDPSVAFKKQGEDITPSEPTFGQIELDAKYLYGLVEIPLEIIQTGMGVEEKINQLLATTIVSEIEKAALNGAVDGFKGIYNAEILKKNIPLTYEGITTGITDIANNNGVANNIAMNPTSYYGLQTIVTSDGQYRVPPAFYTKLKEDVTTSMEQDKIFIGDFTQVYIGLLKDITIDMSLEYGFGKGTLAIRIMWYGDVEVAQPKHLCLMTVEDKA
ncbi:MAG: HK97 family phage prohead protease [Paraclostridium sp.]